MYETLQVMVYLPHELMQDFFHQQYFSYGKVSFTGKVEEEPPQRPHHQGHQNEGQFVGKKKHTPRWVSRIEIRKFAHSTPLKINMSPKKGPFQFANTSSNHWFSGDVLVFRGVNGDVSLPLSFNNKARPEVSDSRERFPSEILTPLAD